MEFLTIYCFVFLLKMKPWGSFQVNETTNVVFMILGGCFISEIVLNLSFRWVKKNTCKIRLHVYTSLRAGVARSGQPIKTLNDKFSLVRKHRSSNQRSWTMIFHRVKFHHSWCRLAIANSERLLRTAISMNKSLYSCINFSSLCVFCCVDQASSQYRIWWVFHAHLTVSLLHIATTVTFSHPNTLTVVLTVPNTTVELWHFSKFTDLNKHHCCWIRLVANCAFLAVYIRR